MSIDLGWRADGIERATAAGGVPLETYRRPGFTGGLAVRRADGQGAGGGIPMDPYASEQFDPEPEERERP